MILVERHFIKGNAEIVRLCKLSKELYNRCNYFIRQAWFSQQYLKIRVLPSISELVKLAKELECYKQLHNTKTASQTIRKLLFDWKAFKKALKAYGNDKSRFIKCPKPPSYKNKMAQVVFFSHTIKGGRSKNKPKDLTPTNNLFTVPYKENYRQIIITPKTFGFIIDVQYEAKDKFKLKPKLNKNRICTIDIGLNNLCAITYDQNRPILVNGRIIKSINQWYNKRPCKFRSKKRYFRLQNYFHHVSRLIINLCLENRIGKIIIGKNNGWKQGVKFGKKTNQAFCFLPICSLLTKIQYKAELAGIDVIFTKESYTSQASFYDKDSLPTYEKGINHKFSGKRKYRGLYITKDNFAINADINGSLNIGRKVIPEFSGIRDRSLAARPVVINPLKV